MSVFPQVPGKVLGAMRQYRRWLKSGQQDAFTINLTDDEKGDVRKQLNVSDGLVLGEAETRPILAAYGLDLVSGGLALDPQEAIAIAEDIGFPVAAKVVSPQVLHKSDIGGIMLNLGSSDAIVNALNQMRERIIKAKPNAEIKGFLIEKMAPKGLEVIVGLRRDSTFGPLMMFGLGGVFVELFKDVGFGVAPLTKDQITRMINETKAGQLLKGYRGGPVYDQNAVVDAIGRLSQLALDFPQISEVEVNPLLVFPRGEGAQVLDARVILSKKMK
ncbi:MAG: acetate--CoA ligase family protein, partial [Chloroflexota bacterium]|nr:acetate--CoA ligase family protein [Chloroflexota bacterium]